MSDCGCQIEVSDKSQNKVLVALLAINAFMFVFEFGLGIYAESTGLIADSIDMLADAAVYSIALYAVGRAAHHKAYAALASGWAQAVLGLLILIDVARRAYMGSEPVSEIMMAVGVIALIANVICLRLIQKHKEGEVHMRASWIFSKNDVIANIGVIISGILVWISGSRWPDLMIGLIIGLIILNGARHIITDARNELNSHS